MERSKEIDDLLKSLSKKEIQTEETTRIVKEINKEKYEDLLFSKLIRLKMVDLHRIKANLKRCTEDYKYIDNILLKLLSYIGVYLLGVFEEKLGIYGLLIILFISFGGLIYDLVKKKVDNSIIALTYLVDTAIGNHKDIFGKRQVKLAKKVNKRIR